MSTIEQAGRAILSRVLEVEMRVWKRMASELARLQGEKKERKPWRGRLLLLIVAIVMTIIVSPHHHSSQAKKRPAGDVVSNYH